MSKGSLLPFLGGGGGNKTNRMMNELNDPDWFDERGTTWPCVWLTATHHRLFTATPPPLSPQALLHFCVPYAAFTLARALLPLQASSTPSRHVMNGGDPLAGQK